MPPRNRMFFSMMGLMLFLISAVPLYREFSQRKDIWWTPRTMLVPLAESKDRVEIYVHGRPLASLIQAGQLQVADSGVSSSLAVGDVGLRFNNLDRVRTIRLPSLLASAAGCGIAACMTLLVLTGRLAYRDGKG